MKSKDNAKKEYFKEIISSIKSRKLSKAKLMKLKVKLCSKHKVKFVPTDIEILMNADEKDVPKLRKYLQTKPTRSISGVSVVAIMTKPIKCKHGACLMCPSKTEEGFPQSYTGKEPATRRALRNKFDPYLQIMNRLEQYVVTGHPFDKVELIIMGGTFPSFPKNYRDQFVTDSFKALNDFSRLFFKGKGKKEFDIVKFKKVFEIPGDIGDPERIARIQKRLLKIKNESKKKKSKNKGKAKKNKNNQKTSLEIKQDYNDKKSRIKCIGLTIETRPDYGKLKHGNEMLRLGCTRVELGIQSVYNDALKRIKRGHSVKDSIESIKALKDLGFKLNFHYMPGLPGVDKKKDLQGMVALFMGEAYKPDMLKIYPCMVIKESALYKIWKNKKFKPLTTKKAASLIAEFKQFVPKYCRIMRVQRDIPTYMTEAGVDRTNLRQYIHEEMKKKDITCDCIRCREIGRAKIKKSSKKTKGKKSSRKKKIRIMITNMYYPSSGGNEFFISAEDEDQKHIYGFCRLRFPHNHLRKEIEDDSALIRELHVYGSAAVIGEKTKRNKKGEKEKTQHKGLGKKLLKTAEDIAKTYNRDKIVIISGVGVRGYYRKLGYKKEGPYMVKRIK